MKNVTIVTDKYLFVKDCVTGFIVVGIDSNPKFLERGCDHCIAICPKNAIREDRYVDDIKLDDRSLLIERMRVKRYVRYFSDKEVSDDLISQIILAAQSAPTQKTNQLLE